MASIAIAYRFTGNFGTDNLFPLLGGVFLVEMVYRVDGGAWVENNSGDWGTSGGPALTLNDDGTTYKVGSYSLRANSPSYVGQHYIYYPSTQDWSYDFTKFSGKYLPATLNFYVRYNATSAPTNMRVQMRTGNTPGSNFYYVELYTEHLPRSNTWFFVSLPLGDFEDNPQTIESFNNFEGWIPSGGSEDWADIDCVEFSFYSGATNTNLLWDGLYLAGYVTRGAKKSGESYYKVKVIRDDLAKDDYLKAGTPGTTDTGTMARLAKAERLSDRFIEPWWWQPTASDIDILLVDENVERFPTQEQWEDLLLFPQRQLHFALHPFRLLRFWRHNHHESTARTNAPDDRLPPSVPEVDPIVHPRLHVGRPGQNPDDLFLYGQDSNGTVWFTDASTRLPFINIPLLLPRSSTIQRPNGS